MVNIHPFTIITVPAYNEDGRDEEIVDCKLTDPALYGFALFERHDNGTDDHLRDIDVPEMFRYLNYLDGLRETGLTNMFGATPYLVETFDLPQDEARAVLIFWMETFSERHPRHVGLDKARGADTTVHARNESTGEVEVIKLS